VSVDLTRLVRRHRHVAPMLSALLSGTQAAVRITDADGVTILERDATRIDGTTDRFPIVVDGATLGWVEGDRVARAVAAVMSYAAGREADKRSLAAEALDRYRELNLVYDLAERLNAETKAAGIADITAHEAGRLLRDGSGRLVTDPAGGIASAVAATGVAELVSDVATDSRASDDERKFASLAVAPITSNGRLVGVLAAGTGSRHELTSADLKLLTAIALLVGPALERARSAEAAGRPAERAETALAGDR
jgi:GAF domain-containing protein